MRNFQEAEAVLAKALPGYESREPQQRLAAAIHEVFDTGQHLIAEAGTGTGKSLAYLIEALLSGERVVISTATKALQDQLAYKDLPFLAQHLAPAIGHEFSYAILKGRSNYLCTARAQTADQPVPHLSDILRWVEENPNAKGERDDLPFAIEDREWWQVQGNSDDCRELKCKDGVNHCYAQKAKRRALSAQVVIVNHAMYCMDLKIRMATGGEADLLGPHDLVVFDEAHELEEYASNALGDQMSEATIPFLLSRVRNYASKMAWGEFPDLIEDVETAHLDFWDAQQVGRIYPSTLAQHEEAWGSLYDAMAVMVEVLDSKASDPQVIGADERKRYMRLRRDARRGLARLGALITEPFEDMVRWVEEEATRRGGSQMRKVIKTTPIRVGKYLREMLFAAENGERIPAVLVSATIEVNGSMGYVADRLGIDEYTALNVGTSFNYPEQARLFVPTDLPDPGFKTRAQWSAMMKETLVDLIAASQGRALLLFTSYREMRSAYEYLSRRGSEHTLLAQGNGTSNKDLQRMFMEDNSSVLLATRSFFTGVDFQGDTLSLVVIDKLPFPVPTDPIVEARQDEVKDRGGSPFMDYVIPEMTLPLKQGFGRLIRSATDRGVCAILDPRLVTKRYGSAILRSLPDATRVKTIDEVGDFFAAAVAT